jgi:hypothetical protein
MSITYVDPIPGLGEHGCYLSLRVHGTSAFIRSNRFIARFSLESGKLSWLIEREKTQRAKPSSDLPRRIRISGLDLWCSAEQAAVAELLPTEDQGLRVSCRHAETGRPLWEHIIPIPDPAEWAEPAPAWSGGQTEEIYAFLAGDPRLLVVCLFRQTRRMMQTPYPTPRYACQTDAIRFDPLTGERVWSASFRDLRVEIVERECFRGTWSFRGKLGTIDLAAV